MGLGLLSGLEVKLGASRQCVLIGGQTNAMLPVFGDLPNVIQGRGFNTELKR